MSVSFAIFAVKFYRKERGEVAKDAEETSNYYRVVV